MAIFRVGDDETHAFQQAGIDAVPGDHAGLGEQAVQVFDKAAGYDEAIRMDTGFTNADASNFLSLTAMKRHGGVEGAGILNDINQSLATGLPGVVMGVFSVFDGFELSRSTPASTNNSIALTVNNADGVCRNVICHDWQTDGVGGQVTGLRITGARGRLENCAVYNLSATGTNRFCYGILIDTSALDDKKVFHCTVQNINSDNSNGYAINMNPQTANLQVKNSYFGGASTEDMFGTGGTNPTIENCITSDASADDLGGSGNLINRAAVDQFTNATSGSEVLTLLETADCVDAGQDLSSTFTDDIADADRSSKANSDVGAYAFLPAAPPADGDGDGVPIRGRGRIGPDRVRSSGPIRSSGRISA